MADLFQGPYRLTGEEAGISPVDAFRNDVIEVCAKVAESLDIGPEAGGDYAEEIAAAIRALKVD